MTKLIDETGSRSGEDSNASHETFINKNARCALQYITRCWKDPRLCAVVLASTRVHTRAWSRSTAAPPTFV